MQVDQLKLPLVGDLISDTFPLTCVVNNYVPGNACRIYGDRRLVVFVSDLKVEEFKEQLSDRCCSSRAIPRLEMVISVLCAYIHSVVEAIYDFCRRHRSKLLLNVDSLPEEADQDEDGADADGDDAQEEKSQEQIVVGDTYTRSRPFICF